MKLPRVRDDGSSELTISRVCASASLNREGSAEVTYLKRIRVETMQ